MITYKVNDKEFKEALRNAEKKIGDLTLPLISISRDWFKENRALSSLKGPGQYKDLKPSTKKQKRRKWGNEYPILFASGKLLGSVTIQSSNSVSEVINKNTLILGTSVPYAKYHQYGTKTLPVRPMVLIGAGGDKERTLFRWTSIINNYVKSSLEQAGLI